MKRFTLFLAVMLIAFIISGCAGDGGPKTSETSLSNNETNTTESKSDISDQDKTEKDDDSNDSSSISDPKALFEVKCSGCHGWDEPGLFVAEGKNASLKGQFLKHPKRLDWTDTVKRMRTNGMESTDEELEAIIKFLNDNWRA